MGFEQFAKNRVHDQRDASPLVKISSSLITCHVRHPFPTFSFTDSIKAGYPISRHFFRFLVLFDPYRLQIRFDMVPLEEIGTAGFSASGWGQGCDASGSY